MRIMEDLSAFDCRDAQADAMNYGHRSFRTGKFPLQRHHVSKQDSQLEQQGLFCCYLVDTVLTDYFYLRRLRQNFLSLEYIYYGEFCILNGRHGLVAEAGDLCLLHPGQDHTLLYKDGAPCRKLGMIIKGAMLPMVLHELGLDQRDVIALTDSHPLEELFTALRQTLLNGLSSRACEHNGGLTFELLQMLSNVAHNSQVPREIAEIMDYLESHVASTLSMSQLARHCGVSLPTLNRRFQQVMQVTPYHYLISLRMHRAACLLQDPNLSVKEVALQSGYRSPLHFSAEFHRFYGCAPRDFRNGLET